MNARIALQPFCFLLGKIDKYCLNQTIVVKYKNQSFHRLFEFLPERRSFRNGKTYSHNLHLNLSVNAENNADAPTARDLERAEEPINGFSPDLIDEKMKANVKPLNEQISTLSQLLNQLVQENSARNTPTVGPRIHETQSRYENQW